MHSTQQEQGQLAQVRRVATDITYYVLLVYTSIREEESEKYVGVNGMSFSNEHAVVIYESTFSWNT